MEMPSQDDDGEDLYWSGKLLSYAYDVQTQEPFEFSTGTETAPQSNMASTFHDKHDAPDAMNTRYDLVFGPMDQCESNFSWNTYSSPPFDGQNVEDKTLHGNSFSETMMVYQTQQPGISTLNTEEGAAPASDGICTWQMMNNTPDCYNAFCKPPQIEEFHPVNQTF